MAAAAKSGEDNAGKGRGGLVPLLVLALLGCGSGFGAGMMLFEAPPPKTQASSADAGEHTDGADAHGGGHGKAKGGGHDGGHGAEAKAEPPKLEILPLPVVLTNLANPSSTFVRLEGALLIEEKTAEANVLGAKVGEDIVSLMRSRSLSEIEGASGLLHLREDINERVRIRTEGKAKEFIINTLVVE